LASAREAAAEEAASLRDKLTCAKEMAVAEERAERAKSHAVQRAKQTEELAAVESLAVQRAEQISELSRRAEAAELLAEM
ncbi:hypothetical protein NL457_29590, partial [Klebsiella pneumoniae]|nr:hypothetical protein [Klebsiella pneumoniae]